MVPGKPRLTDMEKDRSIIDALTALEARFGDAL
jgi:hypothetical protein